MALVKGTNSYATVAEADDYFADRIDIAAWNSTSLVRKGQALVSATSYLDGLNWLGTAVSADQPLAFPRVVEVFDPRAGSVISLDGSTVPSRIEKATIELAFHLISNENILNVPSSVDNLEVGPIKLTNLKTAPMLTPLVRNLIRPLWSNSRTWFRAN